MAKKSSEKKSHEDSSLVWKAKNNTEEFAGIYRKYFARVHTYVSRRTQGSPEVAEDVTQETFVRALRKLPQFQIRGHSYLSYLLRIAHNLLVVHYRKKKILVLHSERDFVDQKEDVEKEVFRRFEDARVQQALGQLSAFEQRLLLLRYKRQFSLREIAGDVGKSENAVKVALSRARKHVGKRLAQEEKRFFEQSVNTSTRKRERGARKVDKTNQ